jgi:Na+/H+ antiporter NhaD/arsenite permease-like protein
MSGAAPLLASATGPASEVPLLLVAPFAALLLAIAVLPLVAPRLWHKARTQALVALACGAPVAAWALGARPEALGHAVLEYAAFLSLLGALYAISGGILVEGDFAATPRVNTALLALGVLLANVVGTTGAAMLLVRPLLRVNARRRHVAHTGVFFIFTVCNTGGLLTPLADPPLFLGYLEGVPFLWTLRLLPVWAAVNLLLLAIYYAWDRRLARSEEASALRPASTPPAPLRVRGAWNLVLLAAVVAVVAFGVPTPWREAALVGLAALSVARTPRSLHAGNGFTWGPIVEVAILFAGIFVAMVPATEILRARAGSLGISTPRGFFFATGGLSGLLDNAPTYVAMLSVAKGLGLANEVVGIPHAVLSAISLGAVLMGANTYLGNGPNFMVKAIAESRGVAMPSFGGYLRYALVVLVPIWVLLAFVAF